MNNQFHLPFDWECPGGDPSFREFPSSLALSDLAISHPRYDHRHAEADMNVVFPVDRLAEMVQQGVIGSLAPFHYSFYSQVTQVLPLLNGYGLNLVQRLRRCGVDVALLAAVGTAGHQSTSLIARVIEAAGIPTICVGSDPEAFALMRPPRGVWANLPDGATFGQPGNVGKQQAILRDTLTALERMEWPGSLWEWPFGG